MAKKQSTTIAKINIVAKDFDQTLEFYRLLGLEIPEVFGEPAETRHAPAINDEASFAIDNETLARIYNAEWRNSAAGNSVLITAQLASRSDVDTTYDRLTLAGYAAIQPPYDTFWGARYAVVADPEGNSVGLESPTDEGKRAWPPQESPNP